MSTTTAAQSTKSPADRIAAATSKLVAAGRFQTSSGASRRAAGIRMEAEAREEIAAAVREMTR